jgi:hypothetical protein
MGRVYGEPIEVQSRDGRPARFTWRKRHYAVIAVQEHWVVNREWWRETAPVPERPELEFWRVEASTAQGASAQGQGASAALGDPGQPPGQPSGTYELRRDAATGTWTLRWIAD